jgi:glutaredoxin
MLKGALSKLLRRDGATARASASGMTQPQPRVPFPDAGSGARIVLYVEDWCSDSRKAERLCLERGWPAHREDLAGRHEEKVTLFHRHTRRQLPLVFVDGAFLGGLKELEALDALP